MVDQKQNIDEVVEEAVPAEPKKVMLSLKIKYDKPSSEDEEATDFTIHVNSKMEKSLLG